MKKIFLVALFFVVSCSFLFADINFGKISLNNEMPGRYFNQGQYTNDSDTSSVNMFTDIALVVGTKSENVLNITSGLGNDEAGQISEWGYPSSNKVSKDKLFHGLPSKNTESNYEDSFQIPGHSSSGLKVEENIYELQTLPVTIIDYKISSSRSVEECVIGLYCDFDVPESNKGNNSYNDIIEVYPAQKMLAMFNENKETTK